MDRKILFLCGTLLLMVPVVEGFDWEGYHYYEEDASNDVVYFSFSDFSFHRGPRIPDIDISSLEVTFDGSNVNITIRVFGRVRTDEHHSFSISGDLSDKDMTDPDLLITFEGGLTYMTFEKNYTEVNLTRSTFANGSALIISIPVEHLTEISIFELQAYSYEYDEMSFRSYTDSTAPIEVMATDDPPWVVTLIVMLIILFALVGIYILWGKGWLKALRSRTRVKCPNCNVLYGWRQKECVHCGAKLR